VSVIKPKQMQVIEKETMAVHKGCASCGAQCQNCADNIYEAAKEPAEAKVPADLYSKELQYYYFYLPKSMAG
jgi:hypothetical protein